MPLRVAVIGGGASGLVTLKYLLEVHRYWPGVDIQAELFEANAKLGGVFEYQTYESAELVSSKYFTAFSDFRLPADERDFIPTSRYVRYLEEYATKHDLWRHIHLNTTVREVSPHTSKPGHNIDFATFRGEMPTCGFKGPSHYHVVAVCTGLNHTPYLPTIPGLVPETEAAKFDTSISADLFVKNGRSGHSTRIMHSTQYKGPSPAHNDETVLILGVGETAMDIGALEVTAADGRRVIMCHRDGFTFQPKIVPQPLRAGGKSGGPNPRHPNKPIDCTPAALFDTAYVPPVIQRGPWLWGVYDFFIKRMAWMISGTTAGFDQWVGGIDPRRWHADAVIFCKSAKAIPYISEQYRSQSLLNRMRSWLINVPIEPTGGRKIELAPWPSHIDENDIVHFRKNDRPESKRMETMKAIKPDLVIFATGYKRTFPFLNRFGNQHYPTVDEATTRGIYRDIEDGIAYIGFVRPALGAIPPLAELQAQHWIHGLICCPKYQAFFDKSFTPPRRSPAALDPYELDYEMHCRDPDHDFAKTKRAVDMESYAYQLALDMGAAPTWQHVWREFGTEVLFTWAMGPNFTPKFRLIGPWSDGVSAYEAASLMRKDGELGKVVRKTGGGVFFFVYTIVPLLIFAPVCIAVNTFLAFVGLWKSSSSPPGEVSRVEQIIVSSEESSPVLQVSGTPQQDDEPMWKLDRPNTSDASRANYNKKRGVPRPRKNPRMTVFTNAKTTVEADGTVTHHPAKEFTRVADAATLTFLPKDDKDKKQ
ncbi:hypothetical protein N0V82_001981 [Gnomoniopsis sp. IMI 355080]|nr:hypothetical protein N0V82_001981 [Gnomoniopsis sp. IMI 355080]